MLDPVRFQRAVRAIELLRQVPDGPAVPQPSQAELDAIVVGLTTVAAREPGPSREFAQWLHRCSSMFE